MSSLFTSLQENIEQELVTPEVDAVEVESRKAHHAQVKQSFQNDVMTSLVNKARAGDLEVIEFLIENNLFELPCGTLPTPVGFV